jgi:hypothetical protein
MTMSKELFHPDQIAHLSEDEQQKLIDAQRKEMNLKPWEVARLDDGPSPWPANSMGAVTWRQAQAYRAQRRKPRI